jgi:hypothetical protein
MGEFSSTEKFFIGVGGRLGWDDIYVSWGQGFCDSIEDEMYQMDLGIDGSFGDAIRNFGCDYMFQDNDLFFRSDGTEVD